MPLEAPVLDDRTFDDLFAEAKALIPRYVPEWTNHNESDPGIALLQLFAWMTDVLLYRLNRVPERNYVKFLQLLGIERTPRHPAATELTFSLRPSNDDHVMVPKGSRVAAAEPDENGEQIVFETDETLIALGARLAAVQVFDSVGYSVETEKNAAADQFFYPFGFHAREDAALLLGFDSPVAFTNQQVNLMVKVREAARQDSLACARQLEALPLPAVLVWDYWDGRRWKEIYPDQDETQAFAVSGHIYLPGPGAAIKKAALGAVTEPLYWLRCRLERSFYEGSPRLDLILINTVRATQAVTVNGEVLGGSSGQPNQRFLLANTPVVPLARPQTLTGAGGRPVTVTTLRLEVSERPDIDGDQGFQPWQEVDDFYASGPDDPHFTLNRSTGEIRFGDGIHGRIPIANPDRAQSNVVARLYRYGGGKRGNLGRHTLTRLQGHVDHFDSVTNLFAAVGGSDEESVEEAKRRAGQLLKSRNRAVTAEDFELLARQTPGAVVKRAKALPLMHPSFENVQVPGVVTVIVVPDSEADRPMPSPRTLQAVCAHLNRGRLLTTEVYVIPPRYRSVKIEAEIVAAPDADLGLVKRTVEENLVRFFHPLVGGRDRAGWPFGQTIYYSGVYQTIMQSAGVERVDDNQLVIYLDGEPQPFCRDVALDVTDLLASEAHNIVVRYDR